MAPVKLVRNAEALQSSDDLGAVLETMDVATFVDDLLKGTNISVDNAPPMTLAELLAAGDHEDAGSGEEDEESDNHDHDDGADPQEEDLEHEEDSVHLDQEKSAPASEKTEKTSEDLPEDVEDSEGSEEVGE